MATALVRRPGPRLAEGLVTHIERTPIDIERAQHQWQSYVDVLVARGWSIIEVPSADDCPDAVFVEDTAVVFGDIAVLARPGAESRLGEVAGTRETLQSQGFEPFTLPQGATLDGGDVLEHGLDVWVGEGGRTNAAGIRALADLLAPTGRRVHAVPTRKVLHLKSAVTALPDGTVIGYEPLVDDPRHFPAFLAVPEEHGAHVVVLDESTVLMGADAPATEDLFRRRGLDVVTVDIGEFVKLEGCVTCLSIRLRT